MQIQVTLETSYCGRKMKYTDFLIRFFFLLLFFEMQLEGKAAADEERQTKMTGTLQVLHIKAHMIILLKAFCRTFVTV